MNAANSPIRRVLVLGGHGMAGHMIVTYLRSLSIEGVWHIARSSCADPKCIPCDVLDETELADCIRRVKPDVVVNAVGQLNNDAAAHVANAICVNALLPHRLLAMAKRCGFRVIHISTDCVFTGSRGHYTENDDRDGTSVYAKTKSLGELTEAPALTIRTSIIGPDQNRAGIGLFHWFMQQTGCVRGYSEAWWNGVTTLQLAKAIAWSLPRPLFGLVHLVSPECISKYELLRLIQDVFQQDRVIIVPDAALHNDKTLVNTRLDFTFVTPSYRIQLEELQSWMVQSGKDAYVYG